MSDLPDHLASALARRPARSRSDSDGRPAAVLVPLLLADGEWHLLLTQRTETVASHKGQVAFPGGRAEPADASRTATALRETEEEIGLPPEQVQVLGELDEFVTVTQFRVTPVVGVVPWPWEWRLAAAELSDIFTVPVRWLADPANRHFDLRAPIVPGPKVPVTYYDYGRYTIWGATARIIQSLLEAAGPWLASQAETKNRARR